MLNGGDGALALHNLMVSSPLLDVPEDQTYIVPAALELCIPFVSATFASTGWRPTSTRGYTMRALLEAQLEHVKFLRGLGDLERGPLLVETQAGFVKALADAEAHIRNMHTDPEPSSVVYDAVLPFGSAFDDLIKRHKSTIKPLLAIRRGLPGLLPPSAPQSLDGVVLSSGAGGSGVVPKDKPTPVVPDKPKPSGNVPAPGSLKKFVTYPDADHVALGVSVYDVTAICKHYKMDKASFCPCNLSAKLGAGKLAFCPKVGEAGHEGLHSASHTVPKSYNLVHINKEFKTIDASLASPNKGTKRKAGS
jgi:hypothetical protein